MLPALLMHDIRIPIKTGTVNNLELLWHPASKHTSTNELIHNFSKHSLQCMFFICLGNVYPNNINTRAQILFKVDRPPVNRTEYKKYHTKKLQEKNLGFHFLTMLTV